MKPVAIALLLALGSSTLASAASSSPAADAYQLTIVGGTASYSAVILRVAVATGDTVLSSGGAAFINVTDAAPPGAGDYRLYSTSTFDATGARDVWSVYRADLQSGRLWALNYDGKSTASWSQVTGP